MKPTFKKSGQQAHPPETDSNYPKSSTAAQKIFIDNKTCFDYLDDYCRRLTVVSICWAALSRRSSKSEVGS